MSFLKSYDCPLSRSLTGFALALVGGVVLAWGYAMVHWAQTSHEWPTVAGQVTKSEVDQTSRSRRRHRSKYEANVHYTYQVEGKRYESTRVSFADSSTNQSEASAIVMKYPLTSSVAVRHHPWWPEMSVLEPGMNIKLWTWPAVGGVFFLFGVGVIVSAAFQASAARQVEQDEEFEMQASAT